MTARNPNRPALTPLNPPDVPVEAKRRALAGERPPDEQAGYIDRDDIDTLSTLTTTGIYEGELPSGADAELSAAPGEELELLGEHYGATLPSETRSALALLDEDLDLLDEVYINELPLSYADAGDLATRLELLTELELRAEETSDPMEAAEEGFTYVPPIDPPLVPGYPGTTADFVIASGLGLSALDEPYDEAHHGDFIYDEDEVSARVRDALRADSSTTQYAAQIEIETDDDVVTLRGLVDDLIDADNLVAVASYVEGVSEVVDELRVRGMQ